MKVNVEFQEPDRKKRIKRIIAREGLIIISLIVIGITSFLIPSYLTIKNIANSIDPLTQEKYEITIESGKIYTVISNKGKLNDAEFNELKGLTQELAERGKFKSPEDFDKAELKIVKETIPLYGLKGNIFLIALLGYPFFLLVRFILWAIKTLKEK